MGVYIYIITCNCSIIVSLFVFELMSSPGHAYPFQTGPATLGQRFQKSALLAPSARTAWMR